MEKRSQKRDSRLKPIIYSRDEHNISRQNIDPDALKIMYRLIRSGYKAYLVGGGVRDLLLNKQPKDFDISTDATPRKIKQLFRNSRIIGRRFKLVHIFFRGNKNIEVSTFRDSSDGTDSFDAQANLDQDNIYGDESTDALRRDLTINGLFYDLSNFSVIDYVGGMKDLDRGIIRVIGNPDARFLEDPVRLLRVVRHAARNNFKIEARCWESLLENKALITKSSQVRVFEEIKKDLVSGHFLGIVELLAASDLLHYILPEIAEHKDEFLVPEHLLYRALQKCDDFVHQKIDLQPTVVLSIVALLSNPAIAKHSELVLRDLDLESIEELVKDSFTSLAVPRKERERIETLLSAWFNLLTTEFTRIKPAVLARKPFLKDLLQLTMLLSDNIGSPEILGLLNQAIDIRAMQSKQDSFRESPGRMRRRQRSSAPSRRKGC